MALDTPLEYKYRYQKAKSIVLNYSIGASGAAMLPLPLVDLVVMSSLQVKMLNSLANHYELPFSKEIGKSLIAALLGTLTTASASSTLGSLTKGLPGLGTATGIASMSIFGGASTFAIGQVFIQHFEAGGTFLDFKPEAVRRHFAEQFKTGENVIQQRLRNAPPTPAGEQPLPAAAPATEAAPDTEKPSTEPHAQSAGKSRRKSAEKSVPTA